MLSKKHITLLLFSLSFFVIFGQETENHDQIEELIRELSETNEKDNDYEYLYEKLHNLNHNKINLNKATYEELSQLFFLTEYQLLSILEYRDKANSFTTIYELQLVNALSMQEIKKILPFVFINESEKDNSKSSFKRRKAKQKIIFRYNQNLEQMQGYIKYDEDTSDYLGSPSKLYFRYSYDAKDNIKAGITSEKDPGEPMFQSPNKAGFDFYSAHLQIDNTSWLDRITLGDFHANFGQGLVIHTSSIYSGGSMVTGFQREDEIRKYSSSNENRFLRGIGICKILKPFKLTLFASYKSIDATMTDSINPESLTFTSIDETGIHSTWNDFESKHSLHEKIAGFNLLYNKKYIKFGLTSQYFGFDKAPETENTPYQYPNTFSKDNFCSSIDYKGRFRNILFFGENAWNINGGLALLNGLSFLVSDHFSFALNYRNYNKKYYSYYNDSYGRNSTISNEEGFYFGAEYRPIRNLKFSAYFDIFRFPWLKYQVNAPSSGSESFFQTDYSFKNKMSLIFRYKLKFQQKSIDDIYASKLYENKKQQLSLYLKYTISNQFEIKHKVYYNIIQSDLSNKVDLGFLAYTDFNFKMNQVPLKFILRYSIFDSDSFNSRIYTYENDVLYAFTVPSYFDKGMRYYALCSYKLNDNISMWLRLSQTVYANKTTISSGLNEIDGNRKTEIKVQMIYKF